MSHSSPCFTPPGLLPLNTLPGNLGAMSLPTFKAEPGNCLARLAPAVSLTAVGGPGSAHITQPQPFPPPTQYSATTHLPQKLVARIRALKFVEMSEMFSETWLPEQHEARSTPRRPSQSTPVTDILVWTEWFSLMAAILAESFPDKAPQLLVYLMRIVHAARNFQGMAWVAYDRLYQRQLAQCSLNLAK